MSEGCIRFDRKEGFAILYNSMVRDPRLSLKTKGLMAVIISLPDDWSYNVGGLAKINGVGKDAIRSSLNELEEAGYLTREQAHNEAGKFASNVYVIHDQSTKPLDSTEFTPLSGNPTTAKPTTGKPSTGNPTLDKKDISSKDKEIPPISPKGDRRGKELPQEVKNLLNGYVGHDKELAEAMKALMEVRTELKAVNSKKAVRTLLNELDRLSGGDREVKLALINQSVGNSWKFVFPIKGVRGAPTSTRVVEREAVPTW